jgi:hypothetical protein
MFIPWNNAKHIKEIINTRKTKVNNFHKAADLLTLYSDSVKMNREDLDALLLTTEFIDYNLERHNKLVDFIKSGHFSPSSVKNFFGEIAESDKSMLSRMTTAWKTGRKATDPGKTYDNNYLWSFSKASAYSEYLSNNPDEFINLINKN